MSVISTIITRYCTAHGSDSLITVLHAGGRREGVEWRRSKLVAVPHWRGAMGYWGLAQVGQWSTLHWLRDRAARGSQYSDPETFARGLAADLNTTVTGLSVAHPLDRGIGIHLTVYEWVEGYWIPELFHIRNWATTAYDSLLPQGIVATRETYATFTGSGDFARTGHDAPKCRKYVHATLQDGRMLIFNNGDPVLFNPAANAIFGMMSELLRRGSLANSNQVATYRRLARRPIEVVSNVQRDFCRSGARAVGGRPHDLAITPNGEYSSDSGDYPGNFGSRQTPVGTKRSNNRPKLTAGGGLAAD